MKQSLIDKLHQLTSRSEELEGLLSDPEVIGDQNRFRDLSREYAQLEPIVALFLAHQQAEDDRVAAEDMLKDADPEIREMGQEELTDVQGRLEELEL